MYKIYLVLLIIFFAVHSASSQVQVNNGVDTTDVNIKEAIKFYSDYIQSFKSKKQLPDYAKYWSAEDCKKYKTPDPSVYGIGGDYPTYLMCNNKTIYYVKRLKNEVFNIKLMGIDMDSLKHFDVMYITNQYLRKTQNGSFQFMQPIDYFKDTWQTRKFGQITYRYPTYHQFDYQKAKFLISQIKILEKDWNLKPIEIEYFLSDTYNEIQLIRGFDFTIGMGNIDKPSGISNQIDHTVFGAGQGENYFHEVVHIYLNPIHEKSPLNEGLAVFYGGSMGHKLEWHIPRLQKYLNEHLEIDLNKLDDFYFMDNYTNPNSTIQALLCSYTFKKSGVDGLKKLMKYESLNEIFEKDFNFDLKNLNRDLRAFITSYQNK